MGLIPEGFIRQPDNSMPEIKEMYAFVSVDGQDGNEGVAAHNFHRMPMPLPLIATDQKRVSSLMSWAQDVADTAGITLKLVRFSVREEIMEIKPGGSNAD